MLQFNRLLLASPQDSKRSAIALVVANAGSNSNKKQKEHPQGVAILSRDTLEQMPRLKASYMHLNPQPLVHKITLKKTVPSTTTQFMQATNTIAQVFKANYKQLLHYNLTNACVKDTLTFTIGALQLEHVRGSNLVTVSCTSTRAITPQAQEMVAFDPGSLEYATMQLLQHQNSISDDV